MAAKKGKKKGKSAKGKKGGKKHKGKSKKNKTKGKSGKKPKSSKKDSKKKSKSKSASESKSSSKSMSEPPNSRSVEIRRSDTMDDIMDDIVDDIIEVEPRKSTFASKMSYMPSASRAPMPSVRVSTQRPPILIQASDQSQIIEIVPTKPCECPEEKIALLDEIACQSGYASSQSSCFVPQSCPPHPPCYYPPRCPTPSGCDSHPMQGARPSTPASVVSNRPKMSKVSNRASAPFGQMYAFPSRQASTWGRNTFAPGERFHTNVTVMSAMDDTQERSSFMNSQRHTPHEKMKSRHSAGGADIEAQCKKSKKCSKKDQDSKIRQHEKDNRKTKRKRERREKEKRNFKKVESETALFDETSDSSSFTEISPPTSVQSLPTVSSARSSSVSNLPSVRLKPIPQYPWWNAPPPPPPMTPWWIPPYYMPPPPAGNIPFNNPYQTHSREYPTQYSEWNSSHDPPAYKAPEIIWMLPSEPPPRDPQPYMRRADPMTPRIYVYPPRHPQEYEISSEFAGTTQEDGSFEDMYSSPFAEEYDHSYVNRSSSWPQVIPTPTPINHYQDTVKQKVTFAPSSECLPSLRTVEKATSWPRTAVLRQTKRYIYPESPTMTSIFNDQEWQNQEIGSNFVPQIRPRVTGENRYESFSSRGEYRPLTIYPESCAGHSRAHYAPQRSNIHIPQIGNRYSRESRQWQPLTNQYQRGYRRQGGSFQFHGVPGRGLGPMPSYVPHVSQPQPYLQQRGNLPQSLSRVPEGQPLGNNSVYSSVGYNSQNERRYSHLPWPYSQDVQLMMLKDMDNKPRMETSGEFTTKERHIQEARLIQEAHLKNDYENIIHTSYNVKRDALFNQSFANSNTNPVDIKKAQISSRGYDNQRAEHCELLVRLPENVPISRNVEMKLSRENHCEHLSTNVRPIPQYYEQGNYLPPLPEMNQNVDTLRNPMLPENQQTGSVPGVQLSPYPSTLLNTNHPPIRSNEVFRSSPEFQKINATQFQVPNVHESINRSNQSVYQYSLQPMDTSEPIEQQSYPSLSPQTNIFENRYPSEAITEGDSNTQQNALYQEEIEPMIQESRGVTSVNASTMTKNVSEKSVQKSNTMIQNVKKCLNEQSIKQDGNSACKGSVNNQFTFVKDYRAGCPNLDSSSNRVCSNRRANASKCNSTRVNPKPRPSNYCGSFTTGCIAMPLISTGLVQTMVVDTRYQNANNTGHNNPAPHCIKMYSGVTGHSPSRMIPIQKAYFADVYSIPTKTTSRSRKPDSIYQSTSNDNKTIAEKLPFAHTHDFDVDKRKQNLNGQLLSVPNNNRTDVVPISHDELVDKQESRVSNLPLELRANLTSSNLSEAEHNSGSNIISQGCMNTNMAELANSRCDEELSCCHVIHNPNKTRAVAGKASRVQPQIRNGPFPMDEKAANPTSQILETPQGWLPITQGSKFSESAENKITERCDLQNTTTKKMFGKVTTHVIPTVSRSHDLSHCPTEWPAEYFVPVLSRCADNHDISMAHGRSPTMQTEANEQRISCENKSGTRLQQGSSNKLLVSLKNSTMVLDRCGNCLKWIRPDDENSVETSSGGITINDSESQRSANAMEMRSFRAQVVQSSSSESPFQKFYEHKLSTDSSKRLMSNEPSTVSYTQRSEVQFRDSADHQKSGQMIHQPCHRTASTEKLGEENLEDFETTSEVLARPKLSLQNHENIKQLHSEQVNVFRRSPMDNEASDQTSSDVVSLGADATDEKQSESSENQCPLLSSWEGSKMGTAKISKSHQVNNTLKLGVRDPKSVSVDEKNPLLETMQYLIKQPKLPLDGTLHICTCPSDPAIQDAANEKIINMKREIREHQKDNSQESPSKLRRSSDKESTGHDRTRSLSQFRLEENKPSATRNVRSENVLR